VSVNSMKYELITAIYSTRMENLFMRHYCLCVRCWNLKHQELWYIRDYLYLILVRLAENRYRPEKYGHANYVKYKSCWQRHI